MSSNSTLRDLCGFVRTELSADDPWAKSVQEILDQADHIMDSTSLYPNLGNIAGMIVMENAMRALASRYSDRPGYLDHWRLERM